MHHHFTIAGSEHTVWLARDGEGYRLHIGDREMSVSLDGRIDGDCHVRVGEEQVTATIAVDGDTLHIHVDGETFMVTYQDAVRRHAADAGGAGDDVVLAPMPGTVISVHVASGDIVETGQLLVVIESMKLETSIKAWRDGKVATLHVGKGDPFDRSAPLVTLVAVGAGGA